MAAFDSDVPPITLTTEAYWQKSIRDRIGIRRRMPLLDEICRYLPKVIGLNFLEIGCAPGTILSDFCQSLGCIANGVEYAAPVSEIEDILRADGIMIGQIYHADFLTWAPGRRFDIVASFGFVEHFENAEDVVDKHFAVCEPGGHVVITMPNFARGQKLLRWAFDRANLDRHNTRIMNFKFLRDAATRNSSELLYAGFGGGHYKFWRESDQDMSWIRTRIFWRIDSLVAGFVKIFPGKANSMFSPYLFAIYRKRDTTSRV